MRNRKYSIRVVILSLLTAFLLSSPFQALSQDFPTKTITIYNGYEAGATTDLSTRALASSAEKILGVPVVVENKPGGAASVCASLIASKAPDGYTLAVVDTVVLTARPHLLPMAINPMTDLTFILVYSTVPGGICVLSESPHKTIEDLMKYAKEHPGALSFGSSGMYGRAHLAVEVFAQCKGLTFKHVPFTGGAPANTALLGKHTDFVAGTGQHLQYVRQGAFRLLMIYSAEKRDPSFPDIPMLKDLGCEDIPPQANILIGPRGIPEPIYKKLDEAFKKAGDTPEFKKTLEKLSLLYESKSGAQLQKALAAQYEWYKTFLSKLGVKKAG